MWCNDVEVIVKRTSFTCLKTGHARVASPDFHHGSIEAYHFVALCLSSLDE